MSASSTPRAPFQLARLTALCAIPLVLFGGSVTTLEAGMKVEGWLIAEGHFMVLFPVESWFRDQGTMVEHTHRLFGTLVGLLAIATVVATWRSKSNAQAKLLSAGALLAVILQGTIGGFRVLENSPQLAFLHGSLAHAVLALLVATAVYLSPGWQGSAENPSQAPKSLARLSLVATLVVYSQVVAGAWYRHALRDAAEPHMMRFLLHVTLAFGVVGVLASLTVFLKKVGSPGALRARRGLVHLLGLQFLLGILAWLGFQEGSVGALEWVLSIAHVLCGGLLLSQTLIVHMWAVRACASSAHPATSVELN